MVITAYIAIANVLAIIGFAFLLLKNLATQTSFLAATISIDQQKAISEMADKMQPVSELSQYLIAFITSVLFIKVSKLFPGNNK